MKRSFSAVIFDYDGVLVDTMDDMVKAWSYAFNKIVHYPLDKNDFLQLEGRPAREAALTLLRKYKKDKMLVDRIIDEKESFYRKNNYFSFNIGMKSLIVWLKNNGIARGMVSGAPKERIRRMLENDFYALFDIVVGAEDHLLPKPNPDPYKYAITMLRKKPEDCCVVENAPLGILSAKESGAFCIAITSTLNKQFLREADKIFTNFTFLIKYIKTTIQDSKEVYDDFRTKVS